MKKIKAAPKDKWIWMPHPAHFICARDCRFHLSTVVGKFIVSTLGEYLPDAPVREILATSRGVHLEGRGDARRSDYMKKIGYETIGYECLYETMVFKAVKSNNKCCPYRQDSGESLDFAGYNDEGEAYKGHLAMCRKWVRRVAP